MRRAAATAALCLCFASTAARAAGDCLVCHGEKEFKDAAGRSLFVDPAKHKASVHGALACNDCHTQIKDYPHPKKIAKVQCAACHAEPAAALPESAHAALGENACSSCHGDAHEAGLAAEIDATRCAECHADEVKELSSSVHGRGPGRETGTRRLAFRVMDRCTRSRSRRILPLRSRRRISRGPARPATATENSSPGTTFPLPILSSCTGKVCTGAPSPRETWARLPVRTATAATGSCPAASPLPLSITGK